MTVGYSAYTILSYVLTDCLTDYVDRMDQKGDESISQSVRSRHALHETALVFMTECNDTGTDITSPITNWSISYKAIKCMPLDFKWQAIEQAVTRAQNKLQA